MDPPVLVSATPDGNASSMKIRWSATQFNGGLPVLGYFLQMNLGYETSLVPTLIPISASTTTYTATNLIAGASYDFRVAAYNKLYTDDT